MLQMFQKIIFGIITKKEKGNSFDGNLLYQQF